MGPKDAENASPNRKTSPRKSGAVPHRDADAQPPEIDVIARIGTIPAILKVVSEITQMRYVVVARVTEARWVACAVLDRMDFGLAPGGELEVTTTLCSEVRDRRRPIVIEHASDDARYCSHPTPKKYGIESYIAVPITLRDGEFFGTLCAIDSRPADLSDTSIIETMQIFADLIAGELSDKEKYSAFVESERQRQDSENRIRIVTDAMPGLISYIARGYRFRFANRAYEEWFGKGRNEVIGKTMPEVLGDEAFSSLKPHVDAALAGRTEVFESKISYATGGPRFIRATYTPDIADGKVRGVFALVLDITDQKAADQALKQSEERFSKAFNSSPLVLTISSLETGKLIEVNDTFVQATGFTREEALGRTTIELGLWAQASDREDEMARVRGDGQVRNLEYEFVVRDGSRITGLLSAERIEIGGEQYALTVIQDITARKRAEEALIKAERKAADEYQELLERIVPLGQTLGTARDLPTVYRAILGFIRSSMPCSAFFVSFYDADRRLRTAAYAWGEQGEVDISILPPIRLTEDGGPNSQAVFGRRAVIVDRYMEFMTSRPHIIIQQNGIDPNSSVAVPMIVMDRVIGTIEVQSYERRAFDKEHVLALEMVANLAAVAIENVRLLEIEAKARTDAEAANSMKDEFLSILSHELRTPLNAMLGWVRMLRAGMLDAERSAKGLEVIERNTRQQSSLIEDLLDVSRIISGKMRVEKELVDFAAIVRDVAETLRPLAFNKKIGFAFGGADEPVFIDGDAVRLRQVVTNLIQNAIKFTPAEGRIEVSVGRRNREVTVAVSDTGVGIEKDFLPNIFDRFSQADASTRRSFTGLGLGLTIVRNIVELHGGHVGAESAGRDRGSTFIVSLPLAGGFEAAEELPELEGSAPNGGPTLDGLKILLIDDDRESLVPIQLFLERQKADVGCAASASEALDRLAGQKFDLVISDIGMPATDGYELMRRLREGGGRNATVAAVALTAYASTDDRERALAAGYQTHLAKPVNFEELLAAIENLDIGNDKP